MGNVNEPVNAIDFVNINKFFGTNHANRNINLKIRKGCIHGIVGENGAGKSTLMSILYGFYSSDSGDIYVHGKKVEIHNSATAIASGIGMVHQHFMLVQNFTVLENIVLGVEKGIRLEPNLQRVRKKLQDISSTYGLSVDPDALVEDLPVGLQQRVEILKALYRDAEILILDEPTSVLTPAEVTHLFKILDNLRTEGKTVVLITHKLKEIISNTDYVSVMRKGEMVATRPTKETSAEELAMLMVGRKVLLSVDKQPQEPGEIMLDIKKLNYVDKYGTKRVKDVSFNIRAGEIVGIAGVSGNGQSELLECICGVKQPSSGEVWLDFSNITGHDPAKLREYGLIHVPEDRQHAGLVMPMDAAESSILGYQGDPALGTHYINRTKVIEKTQSLFAGFDVRPPNPRLRTSLFSGGNQQKVVLAREFDRDPKVLIIGQPTRGVDVGAIEFIYKRMLSMRAKMKAILLVSVELDEILSLSDRVLVMYDGKIIGERPGGLQNEKEIGLLMGGVEDAA